MMRAIALPLTLMLCLSAMPGTSSAQQSLVERGRQIAEKNCSRCHAIGRAGESKLPIAPPLRDLPSRYPVENLEEAFAEGIVTAHQAMPQFTFEPQQIEALLAYIDSLGTAKKE